MDAVKPIKTLSLEVKNLKEVLQFVFKKSMGKVHLQENVHYDIIHNKQAFPKNKLIKILQIPAVSTFQQHSIKSKAVEDTLRNLAVGVRGPKGGITGNQDR